MSKDMSKIPTIHNVLGVRKSEKTTPYRVTGTFIPIYVDSKGNEAEGLGTYDAIVDGDKVSYSVTLNNVICDKTAVTTIKGLPFITEKEQL